MPSRMPFRRIRLRRRFRPTSLRLPGSRRQDDLEGPDLSSPARRRSGYRIQQHPQKRKRMRFAFLGLLFALVPCDRRADLGLGFALALGFALVMQFLAFAD